MISLMFALLASSAANGQAVQATLQSCALENNRYVCRYAVPDIVIVPVPGTNITADAPAAIIGSAPSADTAATPPSTTTAAPNVGVLSASVPAWATAMTEAHTHGTATTVVPTPAVPAVTLPAPRTTTTAPTTSSAATSPSTTTAPVSAEPDLIRPIDAGVLTEREAQLVARCADAGWMSLCLPDDRREARLLRDKQSAYLAVRREVTRLIGDNRCEAATRSALDGGYLALARETREYCAPPTPAVTTPAARTPTVRVPAARISPTPAPTDTVRPTTRIDSTILSELETKAAEQQSQD